MIKVHWLFHAEDHAGIPHFKDLQLKRAVRRGKNSTYVFIFCKHWKTYMYDKDQYTDYLIFAHYILFK